MKNITRDLEISLRKDAHTGELAPWLRTKGLLPPNGTDLILLVHGFNNTQQASSNNYKAFARTLKIQSGMDRYPALICPFYWPSNRRNVISSAASYPQQLKKSIHCSKLLGDYLLSFAAQRPDSNITFIGHSMGCRLVLETVAYMESKQPEINLNFSLIVLMAAAVPSGMLNPNGKLFKVRSKRKNFLGLNSTKDYMLASIFPLVQTMAREGTFPAAVGYMGEPWDLWSAGSTDTSLGHTSYWTSTKAGSIIASGLGISHNRTIGERGFCERKLHTYSINKSDSS